MKASHTHHLAFEVVTVDKTPYAVVKGVKDNLNHSRNVELAAFLNSGGVNYTKTVLDQVNDADFTETSNNDYIFKIPSNSGEVTVKFFSSPNRAAFWDSTAYYDIPLQDFLDILQEWIDFLTNLPFDHDLSNE